MKINSQYFSNPNFTQSVPQVKHLKTLNVLFLSSILDHCESFSLKRVNIYKKKQKKHYADMSADSAKYLISKCSTGSGLSWNFA